jgi:hypothetical protein
MIRFPFILLISAYSCADDIGLFLRRQDIGDLTFMRRELTPLLRPDQVNSGKYP